MSGPENFVIGLSPSGGAFLFDAMRNPLRATQLLKAGPGELRSVSISTTKNSGHLVLLDALDPPSNGDREALALFEVAANEGRDFNFDPPLKFSRALLCVFSLTPYPKLTPSHTALFDGELV